MNTEINIKDFLSPMILTMIMSVVLAVTISGWLLWPRVITTLDAMDQKPALEQELGELTTKVAKLQSYSVDGYEDHITVLKKALPVDFDMPIVLGSILKVAEDHSLKIKKLDTRLVNTTVENMRNQSVSIEVEGSPDGMDTFLARLEQLAPVMRIVSLDYKGTSTDLSITAQLTIETYAMDDAKKVITDDTVGSVPEISAVEQEQLDKVQSLEQFPREELLELIGDENRNPFAFR